MDGLRRFAWFVLSWSVLTVLGGAAVRATGSGAGCGRSWPTCRGTIVPELKGATAVEFTHRAVSGVALMLVVALVIRVFRAASAGRQARNAAVLSGVAIVGEALIGALIVFSEWVAEDASIARTVAVPLHLVNTLLLLAALTLVCFWLAPGRAQPAQGPVGSPPGRKQGMVALGIGALGLVVVAATGAVTALADTLFPKDFGLDAISAGEHFLTRLRVIHPFASVGVGAFLFWWVWRNARTRPAGRVVLAGVVIQMVLGVANVLTGTPLVVSLLHLLVADAIWIGWVWAWAEVATRSASAGEGLNRAAGAVRS